MTSTGSPIVLFVTTCAYKLANTNIVLLRGEISPAFQFEYI